MNGDRVRQFFNSQTKSMLSLYRNIETLVPSQNVNGSAHTAEEGRYIESILRSFLNKHLPEGLKAFSGFILRPATKIGNHDRSRRENETDKHSKQLDIIVYDCKNYPLYEQFEEFVIVPPEGVIAIISVKKTLYQDKIKKELTTLMEAAELCNVKCSGERIMRGPSTCLIAFSEDRRFKTGFKKQCESVFKKIINAHRSKYFDQCIGQIIVLNSFTIFKKRPNDEKTFDNKATYLAYYHSSEKDYHYGLQFLITGILSAYYHPTRKQELRPGYTSIPKKRNGDLILGDLQVTKLR